MKSGTQIERDSHIAMHRQIAQRLREAVLRGDYGEDGRIPPEAELTQTFAVSRITARQAVDALVREGLVVRKQGKGTYVTAPVVHHDLLELRGIYEALLAQGLAPSMQLLEFSRTTPPPDVAARLGRPRGKLVHWRRLFVVKAQRIAVGTVHIAVGGARVTEAAAREGSAYSILESLLGERVERADLAIRYASADAGLARELGVRKGAPLMMLERVSYNARGIPLEHTRYWALAGFYEFSLTVRGKLPITYSLRAGAAGVSPAAI